MTWAAHAASKPSRAPIAVVGLVFVLLLAGYAIVTFLSPQSGVQWSDYGGPMQSRIDTAAAARDCSTLQAEYDNANGGNADMMARTGHGNAELLAYIDSARRAAGCP